MFDPSNLSFRPGTPTGFATVASSSSSSSTLPPVASQVLSVDLLSDSVLLKSLRVTDQMRYKYPLLASAQANLSSILPSLASAISKEISNWLQEEREFTWQGPGEHASLGYSFKLSIKEILDYCSVLEPWLCGSLLLHWLIRQENAERILGDLGFSKDETDELTELLLSEAPIPLPGDIDIRMLDARTRDEFIHQLTYLIAQKLPDRFQRPSPLDKVLDSFLKSRNRGRPLNYSIPSLLTLFFVRQTAFVKDHTLFGPQTGDLHITSPNIDFCPAFLWQKHPASEHKKMLAEFITPMTLARRQLFRHDLRLGLKRVLNSPHATVSGEHQRAGWLDLLLHQRYLVDGIKLERADWPRLIKAMRQGQSFPDSKDLDNFRSGFLNGTPPKENLAEALANCVKANGGNHISTLASVLLNTYFLLEDQPQIQSPGDLILLALNRAAEARLNTVEKVCAQQPETLGKLLMAIVKQPERAADILSLWRYTTILRLCCVNDPLAGKLTQHDGSWHILIQGEAGALFVPLRAPERMSLFGLAPETLAWIENDLSQGTPLNPLPANTLHRLLQDHKIAPSHLLEIAEQLEGSYASTRFLCLANQMAPESAQWSCGWIKKLATNDQLNTTQITLILNDLAASAALNKTPSLSACIAYLSSVHTHTPMEGTIWTEQWMLALANTLDPELCSLAVQISKEQEFSPEIYVRLMQNLVTNAPIMAVGTYPYMNERGLLSTNDAWEMLLTLSLKAEIQQDIPTILKYLKQLPSPSLQESTSSSNTSNDPVSSIIQCVNQVLARHQSKQKSTTKTTLYSLVKATLSAEQIYQFSLQAEPDSFANQAAKVSKITSGPSLMREASSLMKRMRAEEPTQKSLVGLTLVRAVEQSSKKGVASAAQAAAFISIIESTYHHHPLQTVQAILRLIENRVIHPNQKLAHICFEAISTLFKNDWIEALDLHNRAISCGLQPTSEQLSNSTKAIFGNIQSNPSSQFAPELLLTHLEIASLSQEDRTELEQLLERYLVPLIHHDEFNRIQNVLRKDKQPGDHSLNSAFKLFEALSNTNRLNDYSRSWINEVIPHIDASSEAMQNTIAEAVLSAADALLHDADVEATISYLHTCQQSPRLWNAMLRRPHPLWTPLLGACIASENLSNALFLLSVPQESTSNPALHTQALLSFIDSAIRRKQFTEARAALEDISVSPELLQTRWELLVQELLVSSEWKQACAVLIDAYDHLKNSPLLPEILEQIFIQNTSSVAGQQALLSLLQIYPNTSSELWKQFFKLLISVKGEEESVRQQLKTQAIELLIANTTLSDPDQITCWIHAFRAMANDGMRLSLELMTTPITQALFNRLIQNAQKTTQHHLLFSQFDAIGRLFSSDTETHQQAAAFLRELQIKSEEQFEEPTTNTATLHMDICIARHLIAYDLDGGLDLLLSTVQTIIESYTDAKQFAQRYFPQDISQVECDWQQSPAIKSVKALLARPSTRETVFQLLKSAWMYSPDLLKEREAKLNHLLTSLINAVAPPHILLELAQAMAAVGIKSHQANLCTVLKWAASLYTSDEDTFLQSPWHKALRKNGPELIKWLIRESTENLPHVHALICTPWATHCLTFECKLTLTDLLFHHIFSHAVTEANGPFSAQEHEVLAEQCLTLLPAFLSRSQADVTYSFKSLVSFILHRTITSSDVSYFDHRFEQIVNTLPDAFYKGHSNGPSKSSDLSAYFLMINAILMVNRSAEDLVISHMRKKAATAIQCVLKVAKRLTNQQKKVLSRTICRYVESTSAIRVRSESAPSSELSPTTLLKLAERYGIFDQEPVLFNAIKFLHNPNELRPQARYYNITIENYSTWCCEVSVPEGIYLLNQALVTIPPDKRHELLPSFVALCEMVKPAPFLYVDDMPAINHVTNLVHRFLELTPEKQRTKDIVNMVLTPLLARHAEINQHWLPVFKSRKDGYEIVVPKWLPLISASSIFKGYEMAVKYGHFTNQPKEHLLHIQHMFTIFSQTTSGDFRCLYNGLTILTKGFHKLPAGISSQDRASAAHFWIHTIAQVNPAMAQDHLNLAERYGWFTADCQKFLSQTQEVIARNKEFHARTDRPRYEVSLYPKGHIYFKKILPDASSTASEASSSGESSCHENQAGSSDS